jgi:hypothetical protein
MICVGDFSLFSSKQMVFLVCHMAQQTSQTDTINLFALHLIHIQNWVKEGGQTTTPKEKANMLHTYFGINGK